MKFIYHSEQSSFLQCLNQAWQTACLRDQLSYCRLNWIMSYFTHFVPLDVGTAWSSLIILQIDVLCIALTLMLALKGLIMSADESFYWWTNSTFQIQLEYFKSDLNFLKMFLDLSPPQVVYNTQVLFPITKNLMLVLPFCSVLHYIPELVLSSSCLTAPYLI